ncbi:MAG: hypothetical protein JWN70_6940 [Planctomycetaceae bacterium]|nr:hypothetical protein [Planctomycetaceae bacterium]
MEICVKPRRPVSKHFQSKNSSRSKRKAVIFVASPMEGPIQHLERSATRFQQIGYNAGTISPYMLHRRRKRASETGCKFKRQFLLSAQASVVRASNSAGKGKVASLNSRLNLTCPVRSKSLPHQSRGAKM